MNNTMRNKFVKIALSFVLAFTTLAASAQVALRSLYTFPSTPTNNTPPTNGIAPSGALVLGADGWLYGTTSTGGLYTDTWGVGCGTIYQVSPTNGTFNSLFSFKYANGARPNGELIQSGGVLYGTTASGGQYGDGELFASTTAGSVVELYAFNYSPGLGFTAGAFPGSGVVLGTSGYLYGVTPSGGLFASGTIYTTSTSGNYSTLYNFNQTGAAPSEDRSNPRGGLIQAANGSFYGVAPTGGSNNLGFIYSISASGVYTNLFSFGVTSSPSNTAWINATNGQFPRGALLQANDGNLYGVTEAGGSNGFGEVFKVAINTFVTTPLAAFNDTNGACPSSSLVQGLDGYLYGVSRTFPSIGSIYQASTNGGGLTNMATFVTTNGANPSGALVYDTNTSIFYGSALGGGNGNGVIYELIPYPVVSSTIPTTQTGTTGTRVTNTASILGVPPLAYSWVQRGTGSTNIVNGTDISGATTVALIITNVASSNLGSYYLVVTNVFGSTSNLVDILQ